MIYGSVCSGIEAASAAWHPLGWRAAFLSEIDLFPRAVLQYHYPDVPLHGDFTSIREGDYAAIDLLVGGTPCQSFSVAGLRKGLDDDRGNLALEYLRLADRLRPRWLVWENVPGVLSSNGGRDFGSILGGMVELGYGFAYRVLDAQYVRVDGFGRAVPQRRRRVFVIGCLGDWRRAAAVLFERESLLGNPAPRREAGKVSAPTLSARTKGGGGLGTDTELDGGLIPLNSLDGASHTLAAARGGSKALDATMETYIASTGDVAHCLNAGGMGRIDYETETMVAHALRAGGFDASEDGTGRGTPLVPVQGVALRGRDGGATAELTGDVMTSLRCGGGGGDKPHVLAPAVFDGHTGPLDTDGSTQGIFAAWRVRRLTPRECERLQGFPDDFTAIPMRNKNGKLNGKWAKDGPRYKALGNSFSVNVVRWIGQRIQMVEGTYGSD